LAEVKPKILKLGARQNLEACEERIAQFQTIGGQLRALVYRCACPSLIRQNTVSRPDLIQRCPTRCEVKVALAVFAR
jgi:hypothetical protein